MCGSGAHPAARARGVLDRVVGREDGAAEADHLAAAADARAPHRLDASAHADGVADGELARDLAGAVGEEELRVAAKADGRAAVGLERKALLEAQGEARVAAGARGGVGLHNLLGGPLPGNLELPAPVARPREPLDLPRVATPPRCSAHSGQQSPRCTGGCRTRICGRHRV